jgi:L-ornithine N5-oxygenase
VNDRAGSEAAAKDNKMRAENIYANGIYDLVGIGFGPSNLALAAAINECEKSQSLRALFLEQKPAFAWHPNMLLPNTVMQISFLKDLVTQRNPKSEFSFISYLKASGRLNDFINLKTFYPSRIEFNNYMAWVADNLKSYVRYDTVVTSVATEGEAPHQFVRITYENSSTGEVNYALAKNIVVAVGGKPNMPVSLQLKSDGSAVWHSSQYLQKIADLRGRVHPGHRFVVIGRGQSAAEIVSDLHGKFEDATVTNLFRGYSMKPSDSSEFVNTVFDPAFVDEISFASPEIRKKIIADHHDSNYSVVDAPLLSKLYEIQYRERITGDVRLYFKNFSSVHRITEADHAVQIFSEDNRTGAISVIVADTVILATGYAYPNPPKVLTGIAEHLIYDEDHRRPLVDRNYKALTKASSRFCIYLQGCNEPTHGLGDTLLSNLSIRAAEILADILREREEGSHTSTVPESRDSVTA